jgi:type II secretory pathway component PulL
MKTVQLAFLPSAPGQGWRILTLAARPAEAPSRILVAPGASVLARQANAQGRTLAQEQATALADLAGDLAMPADACVCAVEPGPSGRRLAFIASRSVVERWLADARAQGFDPDAIIPDYALIPPPRETRATFARIGREVAVRTAEGGFTCQSDLLDALTPGLSRSEVDIDAAAAGSLSGGLLRRLPNLLLALPRQPRTSQASLTKAGAAAIVSLCILASLPWIDALRKNEAARQLRSSTDELARSALPEGARIVNPLAQLREASAGRRQAMASLWLAEDLFNGLRAAPGVEITGLEIRPDGGVLARLLAPDLALLQPLRDHLSAAGIIWEETPLPSLPNSIPLDLSIRRAP